MKLLSSIIGALHFSENVNALTDDEISAFGCREGIYYQYEKVASNGGTAINQRASGKFSFLVVAIISIFSDENNWDGCHYNHQLPCYKNEQKCEVSMTPLGQDTQILDGITALTP